MNYKRFVSNVNDSTYAVASMKSCTRARVIFNSSVIIAMFNFLQFQNRNLASVCLRARFLLNEPYASRADSRWAKYAFVEYSAPAIA